MSSTTFKFGEVIDEAVERAGLDPAALTYRHLTSINRSLELLFIDLENNGAQAEYRLETKTYSINFGDGGVTLASDTLDVTQAVLITNLDGQNPRPYPLGRTTREDYQTLSFPTQQGLPSVYWLTKSAAGYKGAVGDDVLPANVSAPADGGTPVLVLWPQNALTTVGTVQVQVTRMRQHALPSGFSDALDTRRSWLPTLVSGLAAAIAEKYNPEMYDALFARYQMRLQTREGDEDHSPVTIGYRGPGFGRARRH
jgi:hypothetical protein